MENKSRTIGLRVLAGVALAAVIIVAVFASGIQLPSSEGPVGSGSQLDTGRLTVLLMLMSYGSQYLVLNFTR